MAIKVFTYRLIGRSTIAKLLKSVMATVGDDLTNITPTRGFSMELGTAFTVVLASKLGIPISTTHCLVGSVIGVGLADGASAVNWTLMGSIFLRSDKKHITSFVPFHN